MVWLQLIMVVVVVFTAQRIECLCVVLSMFDLLILLDVVSLVIDVVADCRECLVSLAD